MFRGINTINIDNKGRLAVPKRYREILLAGMKPENLFHVILTIDTQSPCLLLYPAVEWEIIEAKLQSLSGLNPATRRIQRLLMGHATELELDDNGRLLVPPVLRDYAGLDKKAMLVGQGKKFEIWDEMRWNENRKRWLEEIAAQGSGIPAEFENIPL